MKKILLNSIILLALWACTSSTDTLQRGSEAPQFSTANLEAQTVDLQSFKGKKNILIYFWADWCPACKKEFPATQAYYEKIKQEFPDFELLAINVGQGKEASLNFRQKYGVTFPMLLDTAGAISQQYEVKELPANFFVGKDGKIIRKILGWIDENQVRVTLNQIK